MNTRKSFFRLDGVNLELTRRHGYILLDCIVAFACICGSVAVYYEINEIYFTRQNHQNFERRRLQEKLCEARSKWIMLHVEK